MVLAARRACRDAARWMRSARPRRFSGARLARRALAGSLVAGLGAMALIALAAPDRFGPPGRAPLHSGWPALALGALIAVTAAWALLRGRSLVWSVRRVRDPFVRPLDEYEAFEGAAGALASCPSWLQTRFAAASWPLR